MDTILYIGSWWSAFEVVLLDNIQDSPPEFKPTRGCGRIVGS